MTKKESKSKYYHLRIFGCQMNKSDGERIDAVMQKAGYKPTDDEKSADVIIAVACSVRQSPIDRIYGLSGRWARLKLKNPKLKLILTGCVLKFDKKKLSGNFDMIVPITEIDELAKVISHESLRMRGKKSIINYQLSIIKKNDISCSYLSVPPKHHSKHSAYVPIMTGCNSFCAYCVVPYVRGREIFRTKKEIMAEVKTLIRQGYKEITLLGENVNNYPNFPGLLKTLTKIPGKFWLRFVTSNPENFSDELIKVIANEPKICNYIHLPIQSGSNAILKKMNRKYSKGEYIKIIKKIKKQISNIAISTDIIVGFPEETKKQFEETAKVMRELKFNMAYIAQYSPRPGTVAARFDDNISREEKKRREAVLTEVLRKTALSNNQSLVGKTLDVLIERRKDLPVGKAGKGEKRKEVLVGKTEGFKNVKFAGPKKLIGEFVSVKIKKANEFGLECVLINNN